MRSTPEEVFQEARNAVRDQRWGDLFACLDHRDVLRIAENGVRSFLGRRPQSDAAWATLAAEHGFPPETLTRLHDLETEVLESALALQAAARSGSPNAEQIQERSRAHRARVEESTELVRTALRTVPDLPRLAGALEHSMREAMGGGSVSSRLFLAEDLEGVVVEGDEAWGTRVYAAGSTDPIAFIRRAGVWYIRLFAKRPKGMEG